MAVCCWVSYLWVVGATAVTAAAAEGSFPPWNFAMAVSKSLSTVTGLLSLFLSLSLPLVLAGVGTSEEATAVDLLSALVLVLV